VGGGVEEVKTLLKSSQKEREIGNIKNCIKGHTNVM
jgi:hypothetical protein